VNHSAPSLVRIGHGKKTRDIAGEPEKKNSPTVYVDHPASERDKKREKRKTEKGRKIPFERRLGKVLLKWNMRTLLPVG
jgi:hypothetical protein